MRFSQYVKLDKAYKKSRIVAYDLKNLGIAAVGFFIFCNFVVAGGLGERDHIFVFNIYVISCLIASSLYIWPLIHVKEGGIAVSIFKKFQNIPINKNYFINAKLFVLIRFSILFYIPMQIMHFIGLNRTKTDHLSITGFWPLLASIISICVQYIYMRFQSRDFMIKT